MLSFISLSADAKVDCHALKDTVEAWDNSKVDYRHPDVETIEHYKAQPEYRYHVNTEVFSWWKKFWNKVFSYFRFENGTLNVFGWIITAVAVLAVLFVIIKLAGISIKGLFVFSKSTKVTQLKFGKAKVEIERQKLDKLLETYIDNQAFREATRVLFLLTLRLLNRKELIEWNAFKTDREYYYELKEKKLKAQFLNIIRQYEFIWFGKFDISETAFASVKSDFDRFLNELQNRKVS